MNAKVKRSALLGALFAAGVLCAADIWANEPAAVSEAPQKQLASYGNTQVVAVEPIRQMFSHKSHVVTAGLSCDSCHPDLFDRKRGSAKAKGDYNMASLEAGKYCGSCHDGSTAFNTTGPETCKVCHGSDMKQPDTVVFNIPVKSVIFEHKEHVEMGLDCSSCHDREFEMRKGAAEEHPDKFTMEALYAGKYCGVCHNGSDAFASNTRCTTCHIGVKGFERKFAAATEGAEAGHGKKKH
ncbi:MAG: cytochrome c3 family protein [Desulfobulbus sp.]|nr:cytochrome c3 family protein [Desulfobulbus sp.]